MQQPMPARSLPSALLLALSLVLASCAGGGDGETEDAELTPEAAADAGSDESEPDSSESGTNSNAEGADAEAFYQGKTFDLLTPTSPGGGTDTTARLLAEFIPQYVEGEPQTQVFNNPGGGGIPGINDWLDEVEADPDRANTTAMTVGSSSTMAWLTGNSLVEYNIPDLEPLILFPSVRVFMASTRTDIDDVHDLENLEETVLLPGISPTGTDATSLMALDLLGLIDEPEDPGVEIVFGYEGGAEMNLAIEQGEADVRMGAPTAPIRQYGPGEGLREYLTPIFQLGLPDGSGGYMRDEEFSDALTIVEAYEELHGEKPSGPAWESLKVFMEIVGQASFGLWAHPDIDPAALATLREGFRRMAEDEEFIAAYEDNLGPYPPIVGDDLATVVENFRSLDTQALNYGRQLLMDEYGATDLRIE